MTLYRKIDLKRLAGDFARYKHILKPYQASCYKMLAESASGLPDMSKNVSFTKRKFA
jgi:hypothetical protein